MSARRYLAYINRDEYLDFCRLISSLPVAHEIFVYEQYIAGLEFAGDAVTIEVPIADFRAFAARTGRSDREALNDCARELATGESKRLNRNVG